MKPNKLSVAELIDLLNQFDENAIVHIEGGTIDDCVDFGELYIDDELIMENRERF